MFENAVIGSDGRSLDITSLDVLPSGWVEFDCHQCHTHVWVDTGKHALREITCEQARAVWSTGVTTCPGAQA